MKIWSYGINNYHKTASIHIDVLPRHLYYLEKITEFVCGYCVPPIPFPSFLHITDKDDGSVYTWKEWWGDLRSWFHCTIHSPIFDYVYNQKRCKAYGFKIDYFKLKEHIKETDIEYWNRMQKEEKEYEFEKETE